MLKKLSLVCHHMCHFFFWLPLLSLIPPTFCQADIPSVGWLSAWTTSRRQPLATSSSWNTVTSACSGTNLRVSWVSARSSYGPAIT
ncbi:hypothetical protein EDB81DRAFT_771302 [Dactylonectria macrodidyma]|uniref:Secreted protein n=1 Tax=Dactylonectria macrodidyma TaxID=307937 RepID=A0A9P9FSX8_9HYPO|nr:hypothetical protein EDB81DRAFT_771302 [Dactylonectria macrodidyma]